MRRLAILLAAAATIAACELPISSKFDNPHDPLVPGTGASADRPKDLQAVAGNAYTYVSWTAVAKAASYNLYWSTQEGRATKAAGESVKGVASPYLHEGLTNDTTYYYTVAAVVDGIESAVSAQASATPGVTYSITYVDNQSTGGTVPLDTGIYLSGTNVTVADNTGSLERTGYLFAGWNAAADGSDSHYAVGEVFAIHRDTTLYAEWVKQASIGIGSPTLHSYSVAIAGPAVGYFPQSCAYTSTYDGNAVSWQWYLDGSALAGATASALDLALAIGSVPIGPVELMLAIRDSDGFVYAGSLPAAYYQGMDAKWAQSAASGPGATAFGAVAADALGGVVAAGYQAGSGSYGYGGLPVAGTSSANNAVLVHYDSYGTAIWADSLDAGTGSSQFNGLAVDPSGSIYAAGSQFGSGTYDYGDGKTAAGGAASANNAVLVAYSQAGLPQWARSVAGGAASQFDAVALSADGSSVYAAGYQLGTGTFTYGTKAAAGAGAGYNAVLVRYDSGGTAQWAQTVGGTAGKSEFLGVALDGSGAAYAVGYQYGSSSYSYGAGVAVSGKSSGNNVVIVKYDATGTALWAKTVSTGPSPSAFEAVAVDYQGDIYAAGYQIGASTYGYGNGVAVTGAHAAGKNAVLVKYDADGTTLWAQVPAGASGESEFKAVGCDRAGHVFAAGSQSGSAEVLFGPGVKAAGVYASGSNALLVRYGAQGEAELAKLASSGGGTSVFGGLAVDLAGDVYVAGSQAANEFSYAAGVGATGPASTNAALVQYRCLDTRNQ